MAEAVAELGWQIASNSGIPPNPKPTNTSSTSGSPGGSTRNYSTQAAPPVDNMQAYSTSRDREIPGTVVFLTQLKFYHGRTWSPWYFIANHVKTMVGNDIPW